MTSTQLFLSCLCVMICVDRYRTEPTLKRTINEETPINHVIVNIHEFLRTNFDISGSYSIILDDKFFSITGDDLKVKKVIDLDKLCEQESQCCSEEACILTSIGYVDLSSSDSGKQKFIIEIEIKDINDNSPYFKNPNQTVFIPENSKLKTTVKIDGALDSDINATNRVQRYNFRETTNTFILDSSVLENLRLVLMRPIDYEIKKVYEASLFACDDNKDCLIHSLIIINVEDQNDNDPRFLVPKYEKTILESHPVNTVVMRVVAVDADGSRYNKTKYELARGVNRRISVFFKIDPDKGDIILNKKLSAKTTGKFSFKVSAVDANKSTASDVSSETEVVINVDDINDNKPKIEFIKSNRTSDNGSVLRIRIRENEPRQKLVEIKVTDEDLSDNGKVNCELKESSVLELKSTGNEFYEIWSVNQFDYEKDVVIRTMLECRDNGQPPLSAYKTIEINVEDVNEQPPQFLKSEYFCTLRENTSPGVMVTEVSATDDDKSAELVYSIDASVSKYFTIDSRKGIITTASISFDREMTSSKEFTVTVTDDKNDPKTSSTKVKIEIVDVNDNDPVFVLSSLTFYVLENQETKTRLEGQLIANDKDINQENSFVKFHYINLYDHYLIRHDKPVFHVRPVSGEIEALVKLDRETNPNYTLTVKASDNGSPQRFTFANVTIYVRDLNDNAPEWIYPRSSDNRKYNFNQNSYIPTINISENCEKMKLILKLQALDKDDGDAGRVSYSLDYIEDNMFTLNSTTGELFTVISPLRTGSVTLKFTAKDHGNPVLSSYAAVHINIQDSGRFANINLTIIIGMIAITALISVFLIVAIICVKRQPRFQKYSSPSTDVHNDNSNQYFNHNHYIYHTEDGSGMPINDNENFVFLPQAYCPSPHTDPVTLQTMNCSRPASRMEYNLTLPSLNNYSTIESINGPQASQNVERINGTLRSNNGFYGSSMPSSMGIVINGQELDGDSADSGKGASEVDLRLQHQLNMNNRNYPTMPFLHYSTATTSFGHFNNMGSNQYYSINTNPRSMDSRFLSVNGTHVPGTRRVASPSNSNCQCFMLPEDDTIQISQENEFPMSTFLNKSKLTNHERNCIYNGDDITPPPGGSTFYSDYPCSEQGNLKDFVLEPNEVSSDKIDGGDKSFINLTDNNHSKNLYISNDKNLDKNFYSMGLAS